MARRFSCCASSSASSDSVTVAADARIGSLVRRPVYYMAKRELFDHKVSGPIMRACRHIPVDRALEYVAGYAVINDISDRKFRPNPDRKLRDKDSFFVYGYMPGGDGQLAPPGQGAAQGTAGRGGASRGSIR